MMSKSSYLTDAGGHNMPHLMFYEAVNSNAVWGANVQTSPLLSVNYWYLSADAYPQLKSFPPLLCSWWEWTNGPMERLDRPCKDRAANGASNSHEYPYREGDRTIK